MIEIPLGGTKPAGWIVDGQQRALALSRARRLDFPVPVNAFITDSVDVQRDQFLRINNTRPLPRGLVTELLPKVNSPLLPRLSLRQLPSALCDLLNAKGDSPFRGLIKRASTSTGAPETQLHLPGIMREQDVAQFTALGVTSFDSTSAFRQSFKDDRDNYHTTGRTYTAIRVPQVDGNAKLKKNIEAGRIVQENAILLERQCMAALLKYSGSDNEAERILGLVREYDQAVGDHKDYTEAYGETLQDAPWKKCNCRICRDAGINMLIFRGSERNKPRGFHNIYAFRQRIDRRLQVGSA